MQMFIVNRLSVICTPDFRVFELQWMSEHWKSDAKYSAHGVNGSLCSFLVYLSTVNVLT